MYERDSDTLNSCFEDLKQNEFQSRFCSLNYIGAGSGSTVYSTKQFNNPKSIFALKAYNKQQLYPMNQGDVIRQVSFLKFFSQNQLSQFVGFEGAYHVSDGSNGGIQYFIVLEFCHTSLKDKMKETSLTYVEKMRIFLEICQKLSVMHQYSIIHRDLKPDNILFAQRNGKQVLVLSDFGHTKQITNGVQNTALRGTIKYTHPQYVEQSNYGMDWDIYSLSVILFEMVTGDFYFNLSNIKKDEFLTKMKSPQIIEKIEKSGLRPRIREVIIGCFEKKINLHQIIEKIKQEINDYQKENQQNMKKPVQEKNNSFNKKKYHEQSDAKMKQPQTENYKPESVFKEVAVIQAYQKQSQSKREDQQNTTKTENIKDFASLILDQTNLNNYQESQLIENLNACKVDHVTLDNSAKQGKSSNSKDNGSVENISEKFIKKSTSLNLNNCLNNNFDMDQSQQTKINQSSIQKYGSMKEEKIISPKKRQNTKKFNSSIQFSRSNNFDFLTNLAKLYISQDEKLERLESSVIELSKMEKFQSFLMRIKEIQKLDIEMKVKKRLCLLAIIYLISKVKNYQKQFEQNSKSASKKEVTDNIRQFLDKIVKLKQPVLSEFKNKDINNLSNESKKIYQLQQPKSEDIVNQCKNQLQRSNYVNQWIKIKAYFDLN